MIFPFPSEAFKKGIVKYSVSHLLLIYANINILFYYAFKGMISLKETGK